MCAPEPSSTSWRRSDVTSLFRKPGGRYQCSGLFLNEKLHRAPLVAFRGYRENTLAVQSECGFANGYVVEERVQCREAVVPRPCGTTADDFEVVEESSDEGRIHLFDAKFGGRLLEANHGKAQQ